MGIGITLFRCQPVPLCRLSGILGNTLSMVMHDSKSELGKGMALLGKQAILPQRFCIIARRERMLCIHWRLIQFCYPP